MYVYFIGDQFILRWKKCHRVIHFNMKKGKTSGLFSWIHESLKSIVTLRLIFGALSLRLLLRPLEIVYSLTLSIPPNKAMSSYRLPFLFQVFICTRGIVVTVKIKSLVDILRNSFLYAYVHSCMSALCNIHHRYSRIVANALWINPNSNKLFIWKISYCHCQIYS